ncbi:MAG: hypothetical protein H6564_04245 [Lewinellaceae bacterium]|nr:hypothetical protein [Lewinellaceae bacterium]
MLYSFEIKIILFACFTLQGLALLAQPDAQTPHGDGAELAKERLFCQPGVSNSSKGRGLLLQYSSVGNYSIKPEGGSSDGLNNSNVSYVDQLTAKIKIPLVNAPSLKVLLGYEYGAETYHFNQIGELHGDVFRSLDGSTLRANKYSLYLTKSFDEKYYFGARLRAAYRGDYGQGMSFDSRYASYSGLAIFGVKPRPDMEWGIGLTYSDNFFSKQVLPFVLYNRTFNDRWGVEAVLPVQAMARYNFSPGSMLLFGAEYQSQSYAIDVSGRSGVDPTVHPYYFKHSEIALKASFDQHLYSWLWLNLEAGMQLPLQMRFDDTVLPANSFQATSGAQPFFRLGLFLSPTDL